MRHQPAFVVLEGIDGAGTTTQLRLISDALQARGKNVCATREPTSGPIGLLLRQALEKRLLNKDDQIIGLDWATLALLFAADRVDHGAREIAPALEAGSWVLSDRYDLSSIVYQSATAPDPEAAMDWLRSINRHAVRPDLTVVLAVAPALAEKRRNLRGGPPELFEIADLQRRLALLYERAPELVPGDRVEIVDANAGIAEVTAAILTCIDQLP